MTTRTSKNQLLSLIREKEDLLAEAIITRDTETIRELKSYINFLKEMLEDIDVRMN